MHTCLLCCVTDSEGLLHALLHFSNVCVNQSQKVPVQTELRDAFCYKDMGQINKKSLTFP